MSFAFHILILYQITSRFVEQAYTRIHGMF